MKAAIYARAATNEGDVLDNQVAACRAYCKERGYTVVDELYCFRKKMICYFRRPRPTRDKR